jgi:hypothetical protein
MNWFKHLRPSYRTRTRPAHEPVRIHPQDRIVADHWGYTEPEWAELPNDVRVAKRDQFDRVKGLGA